MLKQKHLKMNRHNRITTIIKCLIYAVWTRMQNTQENTCCSSWFSYVYHKFNKSHLILYWRTCILAEEIRGRANAEIHRGVLAIIQRGFLEIQKKVPENRNLAQKTKQIQIIDNFRTNEGLLTPTVTNLRTKKSPQLRETLWPIQVFFSKLIGVFSRGLCQNPCWNKLKQVGCVENCTFLLVKIDLMCIELAVISAHVQ